MRKKSYKGRCQKRSIGKCKEICRTYDEIQYAYADVLQNPDDVCEIKCNVLLDGLEEGEYTTDFLCIKSDGDFMVRECVYRKLLSKPLTVKMLDTSRNYWSRRGVTDWGLVLDTKRLTMLHGYIEPAIKRRSQTAAKKIEAESTVICNDVAHDISIAELVLTAKENKSSIVELLKAHILIEEVNI